MTRVKRNIFFVMCMLMSLVPHAGKSQLGNQPVDELNNGDALTSGHINTKSDIQNSFHNGSPFEDELSLQTPIADPGNPDAPLDDGIFFLLAIGVGYKLVKEKVIRRN